MEFLSGDLFYAVAGTFLGFLSGLIPGVGNVVMLLITYPLLIDASLFQMLLFYLAIISSSQFSGSVVATVFGIPGESSSLPAVVEGNRMFNRGVGNFAISNAALGSVCGAFIALAAIYIVLPVSIDLIKNFYNNNWQFAILTLSCLSIIILVGDSVKKNIMVFSIGIFLALIGHHDVPWFVFLPDVFPYEEYPALMSGLPLFPVVVSLYVFPVLLSTYEQFKDFKSEKTYFDNNPLIDHLREFKNNFMSMIRGSVWGCFIGLVPHVGTSISSNLSYAFERKLGIKRGTYHDKGDIKSLVSAETANNGTAMVSLMPLVLLGIPISTSEALLLTFIEANSYIINFKTTIENGMFNELVLYFIVINIVCFVFSWPLVHYVNLLKKVKMTTFLWLTGLTLVVLVYYIGSMTMEADYYITTMLILAPLGYLLRKTEPLVLLIAFVLQTKILASATILYQVHFL